jgi:signal transduction histidine kinase
MGIPLITKGQVIGVLAIEKLEARFYTNEYLQLSATFASQAAVAMDNANLFEESIRRAAELDERSQRLGMLNKFSSELGGSLSTEQVLGLTATQLMAALQFDRAMVFSLDKDNRNYVLSILPDEAGHPSIYRELPPSKILDHLRESQTIYAIEDVAQDPNTTSLVEFLAGYASMLILPLAGNERLYAIALQNKLPRLIIANEIELARTIGNQASIALENADLYQSTVATAERLVTLNQVSHAIGASLNAEDIYNAAHKATTKLMPVDAFVIALLNESTWEVEGAYVMDAGERIRDVHLPFGQGLSGQVIASGQPVLTLKASEVESRGGVPIGEKGTPNSVVAVPMISGGKVIGALSAQSYQKNAYTENDQQILSTLANQVTVAILNARLFGETQNLAATLEQRVVERTAELEHEQHNTETLLRILSEVTASLDLDRALSRTLALLNDAIGADQGTIMLLHTEDNMLHYRAGYGSLSGTEEGPGAASSSTPLVLKVGEGLSGWVVKNRKPVLVSDLLQDTRWIITHQGTQSHRSALVSPLIVGEDVIGTIMVFHHKPGFFTSDTLEMVKAIGAQVAIAINNAQLYELIRDQAERLGSMLRNQQMEASRQTAILEAVADGVLVTDPANKITFVNASVERILDIGKAQMQGQPLENFAGLFGRTTQTWIDIVKEWSENPGSNQAGESYAEQISLDTGQVALVHLAPVVWHNEFLGTVSIFRDITHEVEVDRLKAEFVATVSHELRTPMTSIRGYVDLLLMGAAGAMSENQAHFLDIVKNNTERLNVLVNDLLDVSRIEAGRITLSIHPVDLQEVASEAVGELQQRSKKENKPIDVSLDVKKPLPHVMADAERIRQILANLLDNAYNYTPADGRIKVVLHKDDGSVQVDVTDTGIGISPEHRELVFDRFFRGEDPMVIATPGTGLGLSIVKALVEMHHGKIWMDSTGVPGEGSTFSFTLPTPITEE